MEVIKKDIYIIKNDINDKVYIGQSVNSQERFRSHCKPNKDHSLIDYAIQKYGKKHFYVEILESQIENYNEREKYWIQYYNSCTPYGYNILPGGEKPPIFHGEEHPGCKLSDAQLESLKKDLRETIISFGNLAQKYNISKKQVMRINYGDSRRNEQENYPIRIINNINGKLTQQDVDDIIELLKNSYMFNGEIAESFGVETHTISRINKGDLHRRDDLDYPIRSWKSNGKFLFTYDDVTNIIDLLKNTTISVNKIAAMYNVSPGAITRINTGLSKRYYRQNEIYPLRKP